MERDVVVRRVEELVLLPIIPLVADVYEYFTNVQNVGSRSKVNLGTMCDAQGKEYKHVPNVDGKEYLIDLANGKGNVTLQWLGGEVTVRDFATVYEIKALQKLERERIEMLVTKVDNTIEKERICREFMYLYYTRRI